jgi:hypothetical protein
MTAPLTRNLLRLALPVLAFVTAATPAQAGWDNVFQVACWHCRDRAPVRESRSYYAPPVKTTQSSSYYEDVPKEETVTVMKPTVESVPVDVQVRSYYWDPVTTYTTRSFYNADGCREEKTVPCQTRYVRKETCNTVTKYVERMKMVPVQETRKYIERTPVTVIRGTPIREYQKDCDNCGLPPARGTTPRVEVEPGRAAPPSMSDRMGPQEVPANRSLKAPLPPVRPFAGSVNARTTSTASAVRGEVLATDGVTPKAGAKLVFLNDADFKDTVRVTADDYGSFVAQLPPGKWHVYVGNGTGRADRTTTVTVTPYDARPLTVMSK